MIVRGLVFRVFNSRSLVVTNNASCLIKNLFRENNKCWRNHTLLHMSSTNYKIKIPKKPLTSESVNVWINMTVKELADILKINSSEIITFIPKELISETIAPNTKLLSQALIRNLVKKFGKQCVFVSDPASTKKPKHIEKLEQIIKRQPQSKPENLKKRPPVVTVMGHVDHGKTTLLDSLRNTFVVKEEFGGITQHIGAFSVEVQSGEKITFIDTPGHAAFSSMRARGAQVTDIVVLVIAADDGVMEQTVESIKIAKRAAVPMIVAVNKIDKPNALKLEDLKEKLVHEGIKVEDLGGETQLVPISALKKINLDLLTKVILLEAERLNLRGDSTGLVEGVIIESKVAQSGKLATVLIKRGTLKKGKILVAGKAFARVRLMLDEKGKEYKEALPSSPVQVFGWKELPAAGDEVIEVIDQKNAEKVVKLREIEELEKKELENLKIIQEKAAIHQEEHRKDRETLENLDIKQRQILYFQQKVKKETLEKLKEEQKGPSLNLILKADVHGSLEVLKDVLGTYKQHEECAMFIVASSIGNITIADIEMAETFNGVIYAFNVDYHLDAKELSISKNVNVRFHNVLYRLIDDLKEELKSRIPPIDVENTLGEAEVLQNFDISVKTKKIPVAGSKCTSGVLKKDALFKIIRSDEVIYEGTLLSLKHFKNEVNLVKKNTECGLMFNSFTGQFKRGDKIICYEMVKTSRNTSWNPGF